MSKRFIAAPAPKPDESLPGYVVRLCEANALTRSRELLDLLQTLAGKPLRNVGDLVACGAALSVLEELASLEPGTLRNRGAYELETAYGPLWRRKGLELERECYALEIDQVCPSCLREEPYLREEWQFVHAPVCLRHRCELANECPGCGKTLRLTRTVVSVCPHCGTDLDRIPTKSVPDAVLPAAAAIQAWSTSRLGTPEYDVPIEPADVHLLARLALPLREGEPRDLGLTDGLQSLPVARRVEALSALGCSWDGVRFDSRTLREAFVQRWYYLNQFREPQLFIRRWRDGCQKLHLHPELQNMLREGHIEASLRDAAQQFNGRPPRLLTESALAGFLGVKVSVAAEVGARLNILRRPAPGMGYDADEVLEARRYLDALLGAEDVDRIAGFHGAAAALTSNRLIETFGLGYGRDLGYVPDSLAALFDRLAEKIRTEASAIWGATLGEVHGDDIEGLAKSVARAAIGASPITGWREPFRLVDLVVSEKL